MYKKGENIIQISTLLCLEHISLKPDTFLEMLIIWKGECVKGNCERKRDVYRRNRFRAERVIVENRRFDEFALYNLILLCRLLLLCFNLLKMYLPFLLPSARALEIFPTGSNTLSLFKKFLHIEGKGL